MYGNGYDFDLILTEIRPKGPIKNELVLLLTMAWHRAGDKPLSEPMMA